MKALTSTRRPPHCGAHLGLQGYARILSMLKQPATAQAITERSGIGALSARRLLKQFHALRLVHRVGWVRPTHGFDAPIYLIGDGQDVPARLTRAGAQMPHADFRPRCMPKVVAFASVLRELEHPLTMHELAAQTGINKATLYPLVKAMQAPDIRLVHIAGFEPRADGHGPRTRQFQYGPDQANARRPPSAARSKAERTRVRRSIKQPQWCVAVQEIKRLSNSSFFKQRA